MNFLLSSKDVSNPSSYLLDEIFCRGTVFLAKYVGTLKTQLAIVAEQMLSRLKNYFLNKYDMISSRFYELPQWMSKNLLPKYGKDVEISYLQNSI